jgi:hypothetical protein
MLRGVFTVVALLILPICVSAQSTASIEGLVTDQNGALIGGAEIVASNPEIGVARRLLLTNPGDIR